MVRLSTGAGDWTKVQLCWLASFLDNRSPEEFGDRRGTGVRWQML
jgi:hypothetical protein